MSEKGRRRYNPDEVEALVQRAQAGDLEARNELLKRFESLLNSLVGVCMTGRPFYRLKSQMAFLKLFSPKNPETTAMMLKQHLASYSREELVSIGYDAVLLAIQNTEKNLAATITYQFKDLIHRLIKEGHKAPLLKVEAIRDETQDDFEDKMMMKLWIESLPEDEADIVLAVINGETPEIPEALALKIKEFLE